MAWPEVAATAFDADDSFPQATARSLRDRDFWFREFTYQLDMTATSTASTSYTKLREIRFRIQQWAAGEDLYLVVEAYETNGAGTMKIRDDTDGIDGTEVSITATSYDTAILGPLTLPSDAARESHIIAVYAKASASQTIYLRSNNKAASYIASGL